MKIRIIAVGKTTSPEVKSLCHDYTQRLQRFTRLEWVALDNSSIRLQDATKIKEREGELLLKQINDTDYVALLDERGKEFTSVQFAAWIARQHNQSTKSLCFLIGGAYGFSPAVYQRAHATLSLSKMTYNHQLIRALFSEQLYRAFTIIKHLPYHHD